MNNRIKELADRASELATTRHPVSNIVLSINSDLFERKFAELIIEDCLSIITKRKNQAIDDQCNVDEAMSMAEMDIEDHFGVE